jgi:hypothetical protein
MKPSERSGGFFYAFPTVLTGTPLKSDAISIHRTLHSERPVEPFPFLCRHRLSQRLKLALKSLEATLHGSFLVLDQAV